MAPEIVARVRELQAQTAKRKRVTVEAVIDELDDARTMAVKNEQASAMVAATLGKAKIAGLDVNRSEVGKPGDFGQVQSFAGLAETLLRQANPDLAEITEEMRQAALAEIQRHIAILAAIAAGADERQH
jgi:hypothetical protein